MIEPATGTLYAALLQLSNDGLIELTGKLQPGDARRRAYQLTRLRGSVVDAEVNRLAEIVRSARDNRRSRG